LKKIYFKDCRIRVDEKSILFRNELNVCTKHVAGKSDANQ